MLHKPPGLSIDDDEIRGKVCLQKQRVEDPDQSEATCIDNVVSFLFKQEGFNDERESLMILIRAEITDIRQQVADELEKRW